MVPIWYMPARQSRRHRQQKIDCDDELELELLEEVLEARCCKGSAPGRWAAEVWSCRRREASDGLDICSGGAGRKARRGFEGSEGVWAEKSWTGLMEGVSREKWEAAAGRMLK